MATRLYRANPESQMNQVTDTAGSATTARVELTVDCSTTGIGGTRVITKEEVVQCLDDIRGYIQQNPWPPV